MLVASAFQAEPVRGATPVVQIQRVVSTPASVVEGSRIQFVIFHTSRNHAELTVNLNVVQGSGVLQGVAPATVTVPRLDVFTPLTVLTLWTDDDERYEPTATVTVRLDAGAGYNRHRSKRAASVAVRDNDPRVSLRRSSILDLAISEGENLRYVLTRETSDPDAELPRLSAAWRVIDRPAHGFVDPSVYDTDLDAVSPPGVGTVNVSVRTLDDAVHEDTLGLSDTPYGDARAWVGEGPGYEVKPSRGAVSFEVRDNEPAIPAVQIRAPSAEVVEGEPATFVLERLEAPDADFTVRASISISGDPWLPGRYHLEQSTQGASQPVTVSGASDGQSFDLDFHFPSGIERMELAFDTQDDQVDEPHGSFRVDLVSSGNGSYTLGGSRSATVAVRDDEVSRIAIFTTAAGGIVEGQEARWHIAAFEHGASTAVGVAVRGLEKIMTPATSALVGVGRSSHLDFSLVFEADKTLNELRLSTQDDAVNEGDGYLEARILPWSDVSHLPGFQNEYRVDQNTEGWVRLHVRDDDVPEFSISDLNVDSILVESLLLGWAVEGTNIRYDLECSVPGGRAPVETDVQMNHFLFPRYDFHAVIFSVCGNGVEITEEGRRLFTSTDNGHISLSLLPPQEVYAESGYFHSEVEGCDNPQSDSRYCPQWSVGSPRSASISVINRNPTISIEPLRSIVTEGEVAEFVLTRIWNADLILGNQAGYETIVALGAYSPPGRGYVAEEVLSAIQTEVFGQGETSRVIGIPTLDDDVLGIGGYVDVTVLPDPRQNENIGGSYEVYTHGRYSNSVSVVIRDNDSVPVDLTVAPTTVPEDGGAAEVEVTARLTEGVSPLTTIVSVSVAGLTAGAGDFEPVPDFEIRIPRGDLSAVGRFMLTPVDDDEVDPGETVEVSGTGRSISVRPATVEIVDDEIATVRVAPTLIEMNEGERRTYTVVLEAAPTSEVVIQPAPGSANPSFRVSDAPLRFDNANWDTEQTVTVTALNDADRLDSVLLIHHEALGGQYTGLMGDTVEVRAKDVAPTVSLAPLSGGAEEVVQEGEQAEFVVTLSHVAASDVVVQWSAAGDSATAGTDFLAGGGAATILAGATSATLTVQTLDDVLAEADETFRVTIEAVTLPAGVSLGTVSATGTIEDDETLVASVTAGEPGGPATVSENGTASFPVTLTGGKSTAPVEIKYTVTGTATEGVDYTAPGGTLRLDTGLTGGTILIAVLRDEVLDPDETLIVTLMSATTSMGAAEVDATPATTTITDDDLATVSVAATTASTVTEGRMAEFAVTLSRAASTATELSWSTSGVTATSDEDFEAVSDTVEIAAGDTSASFSVETSLDNLAEADETFRVTIEAVTLPPGVELGTTEATGTIEDDDTLVASVTAAGVPVGAATVSENTTASFAVEITGGESTASVTVTYRVMGTATRGVDYNAPLGAMTLLRGVSTGAIEIEIFKDDVLEPDETLIVTLMSATTSMGAAEVDATPVTTTITDAGMETVSVAATTASTVTEGRMAEFEVTLTGKAATATELSWSTSGGTATSDDDFTAVSDTVTILAGDTSATLTVATIDDNLAEADETFTVTIAAATLPSGVELGTTEATGTIEDDEVLVASVAAGSPTVAEGGVASFPVELTGGKSTAPVAIEYTVTGTATVGVDYTAPAGTLTLNAGLAERTILIAVLGDEVLDPGDVSMPVSVIVVVARVGSTSAAPAAVLTPVSSTISVSPGSSTSSPRTAIKIVPSARPALSVSVPAGAV